MPGSGADADLEIFHLISQHRLTVVEKNRLHTVEASTMLPIHLQNQTASSSAHKEPTGTQSSLKEEEVIEEDESPIRPRVRCDEKFHTQVKRMTESNTFNFFIIFIIFVNALIMALETEESLSDWHFTLKVGMDLSRLLSLSPSFLPVDLLHTRVGAIN